MQSEYSGELPRRGEFLVASRNDGEWLKGVRGGECSEVSLRSPGGRQVSREEDGRLDEEFSPRRMR